MVKSISKMALVAGIGLALVFTFGCSSDDDGGGKSTNYSCQLSNGSCIQIGNASDCSEKGGFVVDVCEEWHIGSSSSSSTIASSSSKASSSSSVSINCSLDGDNVRIGNQVWMAKNLNENVSGSKCYKDLESNCAIYGRLYNWETATKVCPSGWHLPSDDEWDALERVVGSTVGTKLKATSGWENNGNGTDNCGFSALPGGVGNGSGSAFSSVGRNGYWWSATEASGSSAYLRLMSYYDDDVDRDEHYKYYLFSVRCVQD